MSDKINMNDAVEIAKETIEKAGANSLEGLVGIDPETGEFDINLVPEEMRASVIEMADAMSPGGELTGRNRAERRAAKKKAKKKGRKKRR